MTSTGQFYSYDRLKGLIDYGKNQKENLKKVLKYLSHNDTCNFDDWEVVKYFSSKDKKADLVYIHIQEQSNCSCNHHIDECCRVRNKFNGNEKIVGNVCIKKYYNDEAKETLKRFIFEDKGKKRCSACPSKRAVDKNTVNANINQKEFYHPACMMMKFSFCDNCKNYKNYNCCCKKIQETELLPPPYEPIIETITKDTIITFNPYNGQPFSKLLEDINFCKWIRKQENPKGKQFKEVHNYLINRFI